MVGAGLARIAGSSPQGYLQNLPVQVIYFLEISLAIEEFLEKVEVLAGNDGPGIQGMHPL